MDEPCCFHSTHLLGVAMGCHGPYQYAFFIVGKGDEKVRCTNESRLLGFVGEDSQLELYETIFGLGVFTRGLFVILNLSRVSILDGLLGGRSMGEETSIIPRRSPPLTAFWESHSNFHSRSIKTFHPCFLE